MTFQDCSFLPFHPQVITCAVPFLINIFMKIARAVSIRSQTRLLWSCRVTHKHTCLHSLSHSRFLSRFARHTCCASILIQLSFSMSSWFICFILFPRSFYTRLWAGLFLKSLSLLFLILLTLLSIYMLSFFPVNYLFILEHFSKLFIYCTLLFGLSG